MSRNGKNGKKGNHCAPPARYSLAHAGFLNFLKHPNAAQWVAANDERVTQLNPNVRKTLEQMFAFAKQMRAHRASAHGMSEMVVVLIRSQLTRDELRTLGGDNRMYDLMCAAITECHRVLDDFATYVPKNLRQLWSSDGVAKNWRTPQELLVGMFFPRHDLRQHHDLPVQDGFDWLRSFVALRTWFFAINWMMQRHLLDAGATKMRQFTTALEYGQFFLPVAAGRIQDYSFRVNREKWFTWTDDPNGHPVTVKLSHRVVNIRDTHVRIWYAARLKELASLWGRAHRRATVHDHVAATFMFESRTDYDAAQHLIRRQLLRKGKVRAAHVVDEKRTGGNPNPASAGYNGVFWKGIVVVGGVEVELEFAHISRYLNSAYALSVFNHGVYEVRRLLQPTSVGNFSLCELLFPS